MMPLSLANPGEESVIKKATGRQSLHLSQDLLQRKTLLVQWVFFMVVQAIHTKQSVQHLQVLQVCHSWYSTSFVLPASQRSVLSSVR